MATRNAAEVIRASSMLAGLSDGDLVTLATAARAERIGARQHVFMEGDPADWFCLVVSRRVKIFRESRDGKEVVLELLGPGEPFGGVAVRDAGEPRHEVILRRTQRLDLEAPRAVLAFERGVVGDRARILSERPQPHLAADAVRGADLGNAHFLTPLPLWERGGARSAPG